MAVTFAGNVGIGTTAPATKLDIAVSAINTGYGINGVPVLQNWNQNISAGEGAGYSNTSGVGNAFFGYNAGFNNNNDNNTIIGAWASVNSTTGHNNVSVG